MSVPFIAFPREDIELASKLTHFESSNVAKRIFCPKCSTFVAMDYGEKHSLWLAMGSLTSFDKKWIDHERDAHIFME